MVQAIRSDVVPNLIRNPVGMIRAGLLAQRADLRADLAELRELNLPILALTSDRDAVIPRSAFETVCDAVGAHGRVVRGGHSWLLVDPDSFGEVLASTIDIQVMEHTESRTASRKTEIERRLVRSHLSRRQISVLLDSAAPLWLLSESASTLAGDLLLCGPALKKGEVRALARRIEGSTAQRLTIVARDRPGLLADSAGVLAASGLPIVRASASTWLRPRVALHAFVVDPETEVDSSVWKMLGKRLRTMVATGEAPWPMLEPIRPVIVSVEGTGFRSMVRVIAPDRTGLLSSICRYFQVQGVNIETLSARTRNGVAHDTFLVVGNVEGERLRSWLEQPPIQPKARPREVTTGPEIGSSRGATQDAARASAPQ